MGLKRGRVETRLIGGLKEPAKAVEVWEGGLRLGNFLSIKFHDQENI